MSCEWQTENQGGSIERKADEKGIMSDAKKSLEMRFRRKGRILHSPFFLSPSFVLFCPFHLPFFFAGTASMRRKESEPVFDSIWSEGKMK